MAQNPTQTELRDARFVAALVGEAGMCVWKAAQLALNARLGDATVVALHALLDEALARLAPAPAD